MTYQLFPPLSVALEPFSRLRVYVPPKRAASPKLNSALRAWVTLSTVPVPAVLSSTIVSAP